MFAEVLAKSTSFGCVGADRHERTAEFKGARNGSRECLLATPAGDIYLSILRFRTGSIFPSLLDPPPPGGPRPLGCGDGGYIGGISTRKVDALVAALGVQSGLQDPGDSVLPGHRRAGASLPEPAPAGVRLRLRLPACHLPQGPAEQGPAGMLTGCRRGAGFVGCPGGQRRWLP